MALIKCPDCGKMISDKSTMCIGCGCPVETCYDRIEKSRNAFNEFKNSLNPNNKKELGIMDVNFPLPFYL